ncbi:MAG: tRNA pseudouridine(38-40) synthase TruA [Bacteroidales bacterium]|nr:tRNA pseudouridine(38-40) synthase TruA [Bacteroidales bacterium]
MRYKIELAYNGKNYHGWQVQPNAITVQEVLNRCLTTLLRQPIETLGCGRTDTGVHASHFVAHFDCQSADAALISQPFLQKLNKFLPPDIVVFSIEQAADDFNARFDAKSRTYKYLIHTRKDPFIGESSWFFPYKLDLDLMNQGAKILMEYSDFASFCKAGADNGTTICKLMECNFVQEGHRITFTIKADRFLRNMVRAVTGTLTDLGTGKITIADLRKILESKNRSSAGQSVPAHGLSLVYVEY